MLSRPPLVTPHRGSSRLLDPLPQDQPLGPLSTALGSIYLSIAMVIAPPAYPFEPFLWTLVLGFPIGALLLAPLSHLRRIVFDGSVMVLVGWITMSLLWTINPPFGLFTVRRDIPLIISVSLMASLLPKDVVVKSILRGIWVALGITVLALALFPETRTHAAEGVYAIPYPGWHGFFIHKNALAPYLVFAMITTILFDTEPLRRGFVLAVCVVLMIGSDSATGLSAAIFIAAVWVWFRFFHRSDGRLSTAYVVSSAALALIAVMGAIASLSTLTSAYGKDLTFSGRTYIWSAVIHAIQDSPWVGYGVGGVFWDQRDPVTLEIWREVGFAIPHSHSGTLDVWLNYGIVGLALFGLVGVSSLAKGVRLLRRSPLVAEWLLTMLAAQFLMGLSENVFLGSWLVYAAILRGVAQRELNEFQRQDAERIPPPPSADDARPATAEPAPVV